MNEPTETGAIIDTFIRSVEFRGTPETLEVCIAFAPTGFATIQINNIIAKTTDLIFQPIDNPITPIVEIITIMILKL
ncbi:MAG: hypothetical protein STSR0009_16960 [Methanoregula sp.]